MHLPEFADQPRRRCSRACSGAASTSRRFARCTATAPNQIWTWDITKLATTQKGVFLMACVIIDLFSRYVVGWMLAPKECKHLAAQLFAETIARHGIEPGHETSIPAFVMHTRSQRLAALLRPALGASIAT